MPADGLVVGVVTVLIMIVRREPMMVRNDYNNDNDDILYINISYPIKHIPCRREERAKGGES